MPSHIKLLLEKDSVFNQTQIHLSFVNVPNSKSVCSAVFFGNKNTYLLICCLLC